jgi:predicted ATPase/transcriptional regulator with XRE-family HTH domain
MSEGTASFGEMLRRLRRAAALSQEELAERAGLSQRGISDLERGARLAPHLSTIRLLADALALCPADREALLTAARPATPTGSTEVASLSHARLPLPLSPLVGRERELADLVSLLGPVESRLVTLTGPGGIGKTRLALAIGSQLAVEFRDGVVFVDLAPLSDPGLVLPEVATALKVRETGGRPLSATVQRYLAQRDMLLILDNFEHVLDAAPIVVALLSAARRITVLVTSRAPLRLPGEQEYLVPALGLPASPIDDLALLAASEAVAFFVDRVQAVRPQFALTSDNARAVAEICRRLDGLPLALELAAAQIKLFPPQALLRRLEQRLPLLTGGARTLPARQQTMRNTIAWSHDLLSPEVQTIFRRLAVFPGGCIIDAADAVGDPDGMLDAFSGIASLVDGSLLRQEEGAESEPRFRMLETVREYGLEQLAGSGESDATRDQLAAWCLALAERAEPVEFGGDISPAWVVRLDEELANLRAAINWLLAGGEAKRALRLLVATEDFWTQRLVSYTELHRWLEAALAAAPNAPARDRVLAHWLLSTGNGAQGNQDAALMHARQLLEAAEASGDSASLGFAHMALAYVWEDRGDIAQAAAAYAATIPVWWDAGAWYPKAQLADKLVLQGDLETGVPMLEEALASLRQPNPHWWIVLVIILRGYAALRQGDIARAADLFAEGITDAKGLHHTPALLGAIAGLAGVALERGQAERAARLLGAIDATRESVGIERIRSWLHAERIAKDTHAALEATAFDRAWSDGRTLTLEETITEGLALANEATAAQESHPPTSRSYGHC